jgi:hypothetical protein
MTSQPSKSHEPKIKAHREEYNSAKGPVPGSLYSIETKIKVSLNGDFR